MAGFSRSQSLLGKAAFDSLWGENNLLSLAAEATSCCMVLTDATTPENPITCVNAAFTLTTGYHPHEVIGQNLHILQGPQTDPAATEAVRRALSSGQSLRRELLNYRKNG